MQATLTPKQIVQSKRGEIIGAYLKEDKLYIYIKDIGEHIFNLNEFDCRINELHIDECHLCNQDGVSLNKKLFSLLEEVGMRNI
ncbi:MAG: hypothetical protein ACFFG0_15555 [Candidatus Thorarchaeota archaeon]